MALAGAFQLIPDEPGNLVVVIFPDSAFKFASSVVKHLPGLGSAPASAKSKREELVDEMIENARANPDLTLDVKAAHELWEKHAPIVIDVRDHSEYSATHIPGAINAPLLEMAERLANIPEERDTAILTVCQRGNMSLPGVLFLHSLGYRRARSITGGINAWRERGFATESS